MQYLILDTDAFSNLAFGRPQAEAYKPYLKGKILALTFTSVGEILFGAFNNGWGPRRLAKLDESMSRFVTLPFDANLPRLWAELRVTAKANGLPIWQREHANDLWIAACAIYYEAPLLTGNRRHFEGLPGLSLVDAS